MVGPVDLTNGASYRLSRGYDPLTQLMVGQMALVDGTTYHLVDGTNYRLSRWYDQSTKPMIRAIGSMLRPLDLVDGTHPLGR
jgi:hypothetical protein